MAVNWESNSGYPSMTPFVYPKTTPEPQTPVTPPNPPAPPPSPRLSRNKLVTMIRKQFPGDYDGLPDDELTQRWLAKYPADQDLADQADEPPDRTFGQKAGQVLASAVRYGPPIVAGIAAGFAGGTAGSAAGPVGTVAGALTAGAAARAATAGISDAAAQKIEQWTGNKADDYSLGQSLVAGGANAIMPVPGMNRVAGAAGSAALRALAKKVGVSEAVPAALGQFAGRTAAHAVQGAAIGAPTAVAGDWVAQQAAQRAANPALGFWESVHETAPYQDWGRTAEVAGTGAGVGAVFGGTIGGATELVPVARQAFGKRPVKPPADPMTAFRAKQAETETLADQLSGVKYAGKEVATDTTAEIASLLERRKQLLEASNITDPTTLAPNDPLRDVLRRLDDQIFATTRNVDPVQQAAESEVSRLYALLRGRPVPGDFGSEPLPRPTPTEPVVPPAAPVAPAEPPAFMPGDFGGRGEPPPPPPEPLPLALRLRLRARGVPAAEVDQFATPEEAEAFLLSLRGPVIDPDQRIALKENGYKQVEIERMTPEERAEKAVPRPKPGKVSLAFSPLRRALGMSDAEPAPPTGETPTQPPAPEVRAETPNVTSQLGRGAAGKVAIVFTDPDSKAFYDAATGGSRTLKTLDNLIVRFSTKYPATVVRAEAIRFGQDVAREATTATAPAGKRATFYPKESFQARLVRALAERAANAPPTPVVEPGPFQPGQNVTEANRPPGAPQGRYRVISSTPTETAVESTQGFGVKRTREKFPNGALQIDASPVPTLGPRSAEPNLNVRKPGSRIIEPGEAPSQVETDALDLLRFKMRQAEETVAAEKLRGNEKGYRLSQLRKEAQDEYDRTRAALKNPEVPNAALPTGVRPTGQPVSEIGSPVEPSARPSLVEPRPDGVPRPDAVVEPAPATPVAAESPAPVQDAAVIAAKEAKAQAYLDALQQQMPDADMDVATAMVREKLGLPPAEAAPAPAVIDQLPAGAQPRLPGEVGAVRDANVPTPPVAEAPFSLARDVDTTPPAAPSSFADLLKMKPVAGIPPAAPEAPGRPEPSAAPPVTSAGPIVPPRPAAPAAATVPAVPPKPTIPANVRSFLTRQLGYSPDQVAAMDPAEAVRIGKERIAAPKATPPPVVDGTTPTPAGWTAATPLPDGMGEVVAPPTRDFVQVKLTRSFADTNPAVKAALEADGFQYRRKWEAWIKNRPDDVSPEQAVADASELVTGTKGAWTNPSSKNAATPSTGSITSSGVPPVEGQVFEPPTTPPVKMTDLLRMQPNRPAGSAFPKALENASPDQRRGFLEGERRRYQSTAAETAGETQTATAIDRTEALIAAALEEGSEASLQRVERLYNEAFETRYAKAVKSGRETIGGREDTDPSLFSLGMGPGTALGVMLKQNPQLVQRLILGVTGAMLNKDEDSEGLWNVGSIEGFLAGFYGIKAAKWLGRNATLKTGQTAVKTLLRAGKPPRQEMPANFVLPQTTATGRPIAQPTPVDPMKGVSPLREPLNLRKDMSLTHRLWNSSIEDAMPEYFPQIEQAKIGQNAGIKALYEKALRTGINPTPEEIGAIKEQFGGKLATEIERAAKLIAPYTPRRASYYRSEAAALRGTDTYLERFFDTNVGVSPYALRRGSHFVTGMTYRVLLNFGIDTAAQNLTQPVMTLAWVPAKNLRKGFNQLASDWATSRNLKGPAWAKTDFLKLDSPTELSAETGAIMPFISKNPKIQRAYELWNKIDPSMFLTGTDNWNRRGTFLGALDYALERGETVEKATQWALGVTRKTQGSSGVRMDMGNPSWRGPIMNLAKPFTRFPTMMMQNMVDAYRVNPAGFARMMAYIGAMSSIGGLLAVDIQQALGGGMRPLGIDLTHPKESVKKIVTGQSFPAVRGFIDVVKHGTGTANHKLADLSSAEGFLASDLPYVLPKIGGRYPVKVATEALHFAKGKEGVNHITRTPTGAIDTHTPTEGLMSLIGLKSTRQTERSKVLRNVSDQLYQETEEGRITTANEKIKILRAFDSGGPSAANKAARESVRAQLITPKQAENILKSRNEDRVDKLLKNMNARQRAAFYKTKQAHELHAPR